jgi:hypothetical protein
MLTKLIERLEKMAERERPSCKGAGCTVNFTVCALCGFAQWSSSTNKGQGFKVAIEIPYRDWQCPCCAPVLARAPEVFQWVVSVLYHQMEKESSNVPSIEP